MQKLLPLLILTLTLAGLPLFLAAPATAQTMPATLLYDSQTNSDFATTRAGATGQALVAGLSNVDSASWSTGSGSLTGTSSQGQFGANHLEMTGLVIADQRGVWTTRAGDPTTAIYWVNLDYQASDKSNYVLQVNADATDGNLWRFNAGGVTRLTTIPVTGFTPAHVNTLDFWRVGASIHWTITDVNTSAVIATGSATDVSPLPATGSPGMIGANNGTSTTNSFTRFQVYGSVAPAAATSYTASASASSAAQGAAVTVSYTGNGPTTAPVTPSVAGVTGTFTPSTVTLSNSATVTTTFRATSTGTAVLSSANSGGLTNPASLTVTITAPPSGQVVCEVDSLTAGVGASSGAAAYPNVLQGLLGTNWAVANNGVSGRTVSSVLGTEPSTAAGYYNAAQTAHVACLFGMTNDVGMGTETPAALLARYQSWCGIWRAAGFKTVAFTVPHFSYSGSYPRSGSANFDPVADALDALIRANWRSFADAFVDIATDPRFVNETNQAVRVSDNGHFNDAGYAILAAQVQSAVYQAVSGGVPPATAAAPLYAGQIRRGR